MDGDDIYEQGRGQDEQLSFTAQNWGIHPGGVITIRNSDVE
jgi:hypothetical protein